MDNFGNFGLETDFSKVVTYLTISIYTIPFVDKYKISKMAVWLQRSSREGAILKIVHIF